MQWATETSNFHQNSRLDHSHIVLGFIYYRLLLNLVFLEQSWFGRYVFLESALQEC